MSLVMEQITDDAGRTRLTSLPPDLREAQPGLSDTPRAPALEVLLEAFEDGSIGLYYEGDERAYPVTPWFAARTLAQVQVLSDRVASDRPVTITPIAHRDRTVSQVRLHAAVAEVHALLAEWAGRPQQAAQIRARALVRRLRLPLTEGVPEEAQRAVIRTGDAVASVYASLLENAPLPERWVADVRLPGGLWLRPDWPQAQVAAEGADLTELPRLPARGLIVVGSAGWAVPPAVWQAVRGALEQVPAPGRAVLAVRAIDTAPSAHHLDDLVTVEEHVAAEAPAYLEPPAYSREHRERCADGRATGSAVGPACFGVGPGA